MPPAKDSVAGLKLNAGWITIGFRAIVFIASVAGAYTVAGFWLTSDKHNDDRYVKKVEAIIERDHLKEMLDLKFKVIEDLVRNQTEVIRNLHNK